MGKVRNRSGKERGGREGEEEERAIMTPTR